MATPQIAADCSPKDMPGSPRIITKQGQRVLERKIRGLYSTLLNWPTDYGTVYADQPLNFGLDDSELTVDQGNGMATLILNFSDWNYLPDPLFPLEYEDLTKALVEHPRYRPGGGGAKELDEEDLAQLERWKAETDWNLRKDYKFLDTDETTQITLSTEAQDFAAKWLNGIESYETGIPVITGTTYHRTMPIGGATWILEDPPAAAQKPTGYTWMKTEHAREWTRRYWILHRVWKGFKYVDTDLYS